MYFKQSSLTAMMALVLWGALFLFIDLLQITFLVLKILNILNLNWFWIFSPLWIPFLIYLLLLAYVLIKTIYGGKKNGTK